MLLQELLDTNVGYAIVRASSGAFKTRATIGKRDILFTAHKISGNDWGVEFEQISVDRTGRKEMTFRKTNAGKPFQVMNMVAKSLEEFIERYHPDSISFTAEKDDGDDSRPEVYKRVINRVLKNYVLHRQDDDGSGEVYFEYVRKTDV